jgi:hypothetical protein
VGGWLEVQEHQEPAHRPLRQPSHSSSFDESPSALGGSSLPLSRRHSTPALNSPGCTPSFPDFAENLPALTAWASEGEEYSYRGARLPTLALLCAPRH